jgi:hypothetical protein
MKVTLAVVNGLALLAALVSPAHAKNKFPFCTGATYGITQKNCAKFDFGTLHTKCVETSNCTTYELSTSNVFLCTSDAMILTTFFLI